MAKGAQELYDSFEKAETWYNLGSLKHAQSMEKNVFHKWNECFQDFVPRNSNNNTAKICSETTVKLQDYIKDLGRKIICVDDIRSVLTNKHKFRVIYTDEDTYLTKDPSFEPNEQEESLFSW
jgi:hypothetical protein